MSSGSFEKEIQSVFLEEAAEILAETEGVIIQLESEPGESGHVEKLFRCMHALKGSAMVAGFSGLGQVAHAAESLMDGLREGICAAESSVVEALLAANDWMKQFVQAAAAGPEGTPDSAAILKQIEEAVRLCQAGGNPRTQMVQVSLPVSVLTEEPAEGEPRKILVCDDDKEVLSIISELLADDGYLVRSAPGARQALEILDREDVDVIVTDLKMPEMDGIELATRVRVFNRYLPIVFVSGFSSRDHLKTFLTLGVYRFVDKPFSSEELLSVVKTAVASKELRDSVFRLSNLSFRAYVTLTRILAMHGLSGAAADVDRERAVLEECMQLMREANIDLLNSERGLTSG
jgi:CheY-like chemotaxis protein/HPt (histidine-containing phosphotransfer) domain-containing protein